MADLRRRRVRAVCYYSDDSPPGALTVEVVTSARVISSMVCSYRQRLIFICRCTFHLWMILPNDIRYVHFFFTIVTDNMAARSVKGFYVPLVVATTFYRWRAENCLATIIIDRNHTAPGAPFCADWRLA